MTVKLGKIPLVTITVQAMVELAAVLIASLCQTKRALLRKARVHCPSQNHLCSLCIPSWDSLVNCQPMQHVRRVRIDSLPLDTLFSPELINIAATNCITFLGNRFLAHTNFILDLGVWARA